jgi:hypothetical protein
VDEPIRVSCPDCGFEVRVVDGQRVPHDVDGLEPVGEGYWTGDNAQGVGHRQCHPPYRPYRPSGRLPSNTTHPDHRAVSGDLFPDLFACADGRTWIGPIRLADPHVKLDRWPDAFEDLSLYHVAYRMAYVVDVNGDRFDAPLDLVRLPMERAEARHQLARVLAVGRKCHGECCGNGEIEGGYHQPSRVDCPTCQGRGWLRKPAPAWHLLSESDGGRLSLPEGEHAPALLARHARIVAAGGLGIRGVHRREAGLVDFMPFGYEVLSGAGLPPRRWTMSERLANGYAVIEDGALHLPPLPGEAA